MITWPWASTGDRRQPCRTSCRRTRGRGWPSRSAGSCRWNRRCWCCRRGSRSRRRPSRSGSRRRELPCALAAGRAPVAAMMIDWFVLLLRAKTAMLLMLMPEGRAEIGQRDVGRAVGAGRQEVGRLPDAAAGAGDVDGVARRVGGIDRRSLTDLARGRHRCRRSPPGRRLSTPGSKERRSGSA